jgi:enediyne biosynthesis protein E4
MNNRLVLLFVFLLLIVIKLPAQEEFTNVNSPTNPATIHSSPGFYKGAAWIDFDNDDDIDLFASPNFLFRNDGKGVFVKIENPFGFTAQQPPGGSSWADLNNDGFIDCIISQAPSNVFLNTGNGTFKNITSQIPELTGYTSWGCAIGNMNNDPYPDFVYTHARGFHKGGMFPGKLYLSKSAAVTPVSIKGLVLTDSLKPYTVPYWSDYDLDGDMDLFVASGPGGKPGPDFQYKNMKIETGKDELISMTEELFANQPQDGQGYSFIDVDNDRDLDLCLTNYAGALTQFYMNQGGKFVVTKMPFSYRANNLSNNWGDFDNDGDLDVIITSDSAKSKYYKNNSDGTFLPAVKIGKIGGSGVSNGDYDNDGDLDVFIHGIDSARALYNNNASSNGNNWINVRCTGNTCGKSALGTVVSIKTTVDGKTVWQMREINAQNSFLSQNDLRVHFGIGKAKIIETLIVKYPGGLAQTFTNIVANTFYSHEEGSGKLTKVNRK